MRSARNFGNCVTLTVLQALDHLAPEGVLDPIAVLLDTKGLPVHLLQVHLRLLHEASLPLLLIIAAMIAGRSSLTTLR